MSARAWAVVAALLMMAAPLGAQGVITGRVVDSDSGEPVPEATVAARVGTARALTDSAGRFTLAVAAGRGRARVQRIGYEEREISWDLRGAEGDVGTVELELEPLTLEALRVELDRLDRVAKEAAYSVQRMGEQELALSSFGTAYDAISQRFNLEAGDCRPIRAAMGTCRRVRGSATTICLVVDEGYMPGGLASLQAYRPPELGRVYSVAGGRAIMVYTRWFLERATRKRNWTPMSIEQQLTAFCSQGI